MSTSGAALFTPFSTIHTRPARSQTYMRPFASNATPTGASQGPATGVVVNPEGNAALAALARHNHGVTHDSNTSDIGRMAIRHRTRTERARERSIRSQVNPPERCV